MPNAAPLSATANETDIQILPHSFYDAAPQETLLGPVANAVAHLFWPQHLRTMSDFWSAVLFGHPHKKGRRFSRYVGLPVEGAHFKQWLQLFFDTVCADFSRTEADKTRR
ncbi:group III truncated hemoglobin [Hymenobacter busanensis]|uniref:Group III truncated hemoglobin n=1 Tax=Hymenobacter busanensis TaxID=2607656 RepID=A0A7L4ZX44_9BACT|nr:group III truncated hemoglobin [Hymenobacter busanensis]KAA9333244.1 group III truncated hemoglobin [Hymenobacter busanensis]QHJ08079.1 sec-independent protein translocase TatC [Hymenobacter busanensis]